jgi:hypothetical protein
MKLSASQLDRIATASENILKLASSRSMLASLLIWGVAGLIWWQALA